MRNATANAPDAGTGDRTRRMLREGALIAYGLLALFLLIALVSHSPDDPGFSDTGGEGPVRNAVGVTGAWLADVLLMLFGHMAYALPALPALKIRAALRGAGPALSWREAGLRTGGALLLGASACGLATLHFAAAPGVPAGGVAGAILVDLLRPVLATLGSTLVLLAAFLFGLSLAASVSWLAAADATGAWCLRLAARVREWVEGRLERRRQEGAARERAASRKQSLEIHIEREKRRVPPVIAPAPPGPPPRSGRVEREQQRPLFEAASVKELPPINLLDAWKESNSSGFSRDSLEALSRLLELKLRDFGIESEVTAVHPGPVITRFEVQPAAGVKVSRISNLVKDLARSLAVVSVRVVEVIPGKSVVGIEIPNERRELIHLSKVLSSPEFDKAASPLSMALGHDTLGNPCIVDLSAMPHLLVAGTTGSGKSVGINAMILSLLFKSTPEQVRMIMIDPKMLELSVYAGIPHLLTPVITDMRDAANGLRWCVAEMDRRYRLMSALGVRSLAGFNKKTADALKAGEPIADPSFRPGEGDGEAAPALEPLPRIVVVVDELADMMMVVGKKVEELIARIAQKARAAGIHLILATQRPSVDVLTGLIKANIPTRLSFMVQSKIDSRTILGEGGAEQLLGHGDMLFLPPGGSVPSRVHGAFVSDDEVHRVAADWKRRGKPVYIDDVTTGQDDAGAGFGGGDGGEEDEPLYDDAVRFVTESRKASISSVQRQLRIGYNRAARMIEMMEAAGVVSAVSGSGAREVIAPPPPGAD